MDAACEDANRQACGSKECMARSGSDGVDSPSDSASHGPLPSDASAATWGQWLAEWRRQKEKEGQAHLGVCAQL